MPLLIHGITPKKIENFESLTRRAGFSLVTKRIDKSTCLVETEKASEHNFTAYVLELGDMKLKVDIFEPDDQVNFNEGE